MALILPPSSGLSSFPAPLFILFLSMVAATTTTAQTQTQTEPPSACIRAMQQADVDNNFLLNVDEYPTFVELYSGRSDCQIGGTLLGSIFNVYACPESCSVREDPTCCRNIDIREGDDNAQTFVSFCSLFDRILDKECPSASPAPTPITTISESPSIAAMATIPTSDPSLRPTLQPTWSSLRTVSPTFDPPSTLSPTAIPSLLQSNTPTIMSSSLQSNAPTSFDDPLASMPPTAISATTISIEYTVTISNNENGEIPSPAAYFPILIGTMDVLATSTLAQVLLDKQNDQRQERIPKFDSVPPKNGGRFLLAQRVQKTGSVKELMTYHQYVQDQRNRQRQKPRFRQLQVQQPQNSSRVIVPTSIEFAMDRECGEGQSINRSDTILLSQACQPVRAVIILENPSNDIEASFRTALLNAIENGAFAALLQDLYPDSIISIGQVSDDASPTSSPSSSSMPSMQLPIIVPTSFPTATETTAPKSTRPPQGFPTVGRETSSNEDVVDTRLVIALAIIGFLAIVASCVLLYALYWKHHYRHTDSMDNSSSENSSSSSGEKSDTNTASQSPSVEDDSRYSGHSARSDAIASGVQQQQQSSRHRRPQNNASDTAMQIPPSAMGVPNEPQRRKLPPLRPLLPPPDAVLVPALPPLSFEDSSQNSDSLFLSDSSMTNPPTARSQRTDTFIRHGASEILLSPILRNPKTVPRVSSSYDELNSGNPATSSAGCYAIPKIEKRNPTTSDDSKAFVFEDTSIVSANDSYIDAGSSNLCFTGSQNRMASAVPYASLDMTDNHLLQSEGANNREAMDDEVYNGVDYSDDDDEDMVIAGAMDHLQFEEVHEETKNEKLVKLMVFHDDFEDEDLVNYRRRPISVDAGAKAAEGTGRVQNNHQANELHDKLILQSSSSLNSSSIDEAMFEDQENKVPGIVEHNWSYDNDDQLFLPSRSLGQESGAFPSINDRHAASTWQRRMDGPKRTLISVSEEDSSSLDTSNFV